MFNCLFAVNRPFPQRGEMSNQTFEQGNQEYMETEGVERCRDGKKLKKCWQKHVGLYYYF